MYPYEAGPSRKDGSTDALRKEAVCGGNIKRVEAKRCKVRLWNTTYPIDCARTNQQKIANHFCLSEQTVKTTFYRMKRKLGADNRLGIVQMCHTQGFLL